MTNPPLVSRLEIEPLRNVFPKEAHHFTTWLERHIEALAQRLDMDLTVVQREKKVGDFNVDLLCEARDGHLVIIENQLESTNHDHLGKLLTYLVNLDAKTGIWVTAQPRAEHQRVIDWLNESTPADMAFYLVKVEAVRIDDSPYAPLFSVVARPNAQAKEIGEGKKEWAVRQINRYEFWKGLLERSKGKTTLFSSIGPGRESWIGSGAGRAGLAFNYGIFMDSGSAELYIDSNRDAGQTNKAIFDQLHAQKDAIEKEFGAPLQWERLDDKRASRIRYRITGQGGLARPDTWPTLQDAMIDAMIRLHGALHPRLQKISI